jgi:deoxycytidylate deaminase
MTSILETLVRVAEKSNMKHRHGSCIVYRNKIISTGYNYNNKLSGLSEYYSSNKFSTHAEKDAIKKIKDAKILSKSIIYVIRLQSDQNGTISIIQGEPCHHCNALISKYKLNIRHVREHV